MSVVETPAPLMSKLTVLRASITLCLTGVVLSLGTLIAMGGAIPHIAAQTMVAAALLVLAALLLLLVWYAATFVTEGNRGTKVSSANYLFLAPVLWMLQAGNHYNLLQWENLAIASAVVAVLAILTLIWAPRPKPTKTPAKYAIIVAAFAAGLGWSGATFVNCLFDPAPGQIYHATIKQKYTTYTRRRGTSSNLVLMPFGPVKHQVIVEVGDATYKSANAGGTACVQVHSGALGFAWWRVGC